MSHELKTPLNAVLGFSEIIRDEMLGPVGRAGLSRLCRRHPHERHAAAGDHQRRAGRVAAGRRAAHHRCAAARICCDIVGAGDQAGARASPAMTSARSTIDVPAGMPSLACRSAPPAPRRWAICLANALKFTPERRQGPLSRAAAGPMAACICIVEDTGIGMAQETIAAALEPFRQLDGSLARRFEGAGLGLSHRQGAGRAAWRQPCDRKRGGRGHHASPSPCRRPAWCRARRCQASPEHSFAPAPARATQPP